MGQIPPLRRYDSNLFQLSSVFRTDALKPTGAGCHGQLPRDGEPLRDEGHPRLRRPVADRLVYSGEFSLFVRGEGNNYVAESDRFIEFEADPQREIIAF